MTQSNTRDWVRMVGIVGAALVVAGAVFMGGIWGAAALGWIDAPWTHMTTMDGHNGSMGKHGAMSWGQGGMRGNHDDMQFGRHEMRGMAGDGMDGHMGKMYGLDGVMHAQAGDEDILVHVLFELQNEQNIANLLAETNPAAKQIADRRAADIAALTALQQNWYPNAAIATGSVSTATVDDLQSLMLHNTLMIERLSTATFEHPELATWITQHLVQRANEIVTLYAQ
ncbi:MAG: hypothetical protein FJ040_11900 [Chloroflexi bacterium]|nr:hypothetical protein [Chloroflexota bacterium]